MSDQPPSVPEQPPSRPDQPETPPDQARSAPQEPAAASEEPAAASEPGQGARVEPQPAPSQPPAAPAAAAAAAPTPEWEGAAASSAPGLGSGYPVTVIFPPDEGQNRLWGIPYLGMLLRAILAIPQYIVLAILGILVWLVALVNWIPILVNGRQASFAYTIIGGYLRLSTRTAGYVLLANGRYPPFGLGGEHPIDVTFDEIEEQNRLWGIPFVGPLVRSILLIPHFFVLVALALIVGVVILIAWIPILVNGRAADWAIRWIGGLYRWGARVSAYQLLLTGKYPPFRLDD